MSRSSPVGVENQEMLWVLWTGFEDGLAYAERHPVTLPYLDVDRVVDTATVACEQGLEESEPIDWVVFRPAYTYGWMAGYLATQHSHTSRAVGAPTIHIMSAGG